MVKVVFLGDSITEYFPYVYKEKIGDIDDEIIFHGYENIGCETFRRYCWPRIDHDADLYILLIGINNLFRPDCDYDGKESLEDVPKKLKHMISDIRRDSPNATLLVQSLYPTDDRTRIKNNILYVNNELISICEEEGVEYLDMHSLLVDEEGYAKLEYFDDGIHPNALGYSVVAGKVNERIKAMKNGGYSKIKKDSTEEN